MRDAGATLLPGRGCTALSPNEAACDPLGPIDARLGDGDDTSAVYTAGPARLHGGPGDDVLHGGEGNETLSGEDGDDVLRGGIGEDWLAGGVGADSIGGGRGSVHDLEGGGRSGGGLFFAGCELEYEGDVSLDVVSYSGAAQSVSVTLDGVANDGLPGEGDDVLPDVEWILGGRGADHVRAAGGTLIFEGFGGADVFVGGAGPNMLIGGGGDDRFAGEAGNDCAAGQRGNDRLAGGAGADLLIGGRGVDRLSGQTGADRLISRDGTPETVYGGAGFDQALVDRADRLVGIERSFTQPPRVEPPPPPSPALTGRPDGHARYFPRIGRR